MKLRGTKLKGPVLAVPASWRTTEVLYNPQLPLSVSPKGNTVEGGLIGIEALSIIEIPLYNDAVTLRDPGINVQLAATWFIAACTPPRVDDLYNPLFVASTNCSWLPSGNCPESVVDIIAIL